MRNPTILTIPAIGAVFAQIAVAEHHESDEACETVKQSTTVFQDVSAMNRRKGAGENLTELHRKYEAQGWLFEDLEVYVEDGDLEVFLSRIRKLHANPIRNRPLIELAPFSDPKTNGQSTTCQKHFLYAENTARIDLPPCQCRGKQARVSY